MLRGQQPSPEVESSRESTEDKATDTEDELSAASGRVLRADWRGFSGAWFKDALTCPCSCHSFSLNRPVLGQGFLKPLCKAQGPEITLASSFQASDAVASCSSGAFAGLCSQHLPGLPSQLHHHNSRQQRGSLILQKLAGWLSKAWLPRSPTSAHTLHYSAPDSQFLKQTEKGVCTQKGPGRLSLHPTICTFLPWVASL